MGIAGLAVQLVDEGNSESVVRFLIEWVSDGEAEARRYLAEHAEPDGASLIAAAGSGVIGYVAIASNAGQRRGAEDNAGHPLRAETLLHAELISRYGVPPAQYR